MKLNETTMKLSVQTLALLKNFSGINQSILFKKGRSLRTISVMKNILAEVTINEEIPQDFGIYDLNQFLNGLSLHQSPDLDFTNDGYVVIKEGRSRSLQTDHSANQTVTLQRLYSQLCKTEDADFKNTKNTRERYYQGCEEDEEEARQKYQQMMEDDF